MNEIESDVKQRVKRALHYKKPAFWVILAALVACALLAVCFLTNPREKPAAGGEPVPSLVYEGLLFKTTGKQSPVEPDESAIVGRISSVVPSGQWPQEDWQANFDAKDAPVAMMSGKLYVLWNQEWVRFKPAANQTAEAEWHPAVKWFDCFHGDAWDLLHEAKEITLAEYPDTVLRCDDRSMTLVSGQERKEIYTDTRTWSAYFCDLTGDGKPELCTACSWQGGFVEYHIAVYDFETESCCMLQDPLDYSYILNLRDGMLTAEQRRGGTWPGTEQILAEGSLRLDGKLLRFIPERRDASEQRVSFRAEILELDSQAMLVRPAEGSAELRSCDKIWVPTRLLLTPGAEVGSTIEIAYDGQIMETYPGQIGKVDSIRIVDQKGSKEAMTVKVVRAEYREKGGVLAERCQNADKLGGGTELHYPVFRCETKAELEEFKALYEQIVLQLYPENLEPPQPVDQVGEYEEGFFAGRFLLIAYVVSGSGSLRYGVRDVTVEGGQLCMNVIQTNDPAARTCDMAAWLVIAELPKSMLEGVTGFDARLVGIEPEGN